MGFPFLLMNLDWGCSGFQFYFFFPLPVEGKDKVKEKYKYKYKEKDNGRQRGLHGILLLVDEPGLRLLWFPTFFSPHFPSIIPHFCFSFQHNFIKRIHNLEMTSRLVFLDLYHNRWKIHPDCRNSKHSLRGWTMCNHFHFSQSIPFAFWFLRRNYTNTKCV